MVVPRDPTSSPRSPVSEKYGKLFKLRRHGGLREIADLWRFENENKPDAAANPQIDSNPLDVYTDDGRVYADGFTNAIDLDSGVTARSTCSRLTTTRC